MRRFLFFACVAGGTAALIIGGFLFREASASRAMSPLPVLGQVPSFALVDHHGRPFSDGDLRGRVWVADFVFTRCAGQCPMMHERMRDLSQIIRNPDVRLVSFSVDPEWDTPQVLAAYVAQQGWPTHQWSFVTGARAEIERVCRDGFHLSMGSEDAGAEPVTHSVRLALVDRQGGIRGYYDATDDSRLTQLTRDLQQLAASAD